MGVDADIYLRASVAEPEIALPKGYAIERRGRGDDAWPDTSTHRVVTLDRYYGVSCERGPWPAICSALLEIHAHPDVERVWYDGDDAWTTRDCPPSRVLELCAHYMTHGRGAWGARARDRQADMERSARKRGFDRSADIGARERLRGYFGVDVLPDRADLDRDDPPEPPPLPEPPRVFEVCCPSCRIMTRVDIPDLGPEVRWMYCSVCNQRAFFAFRRTDGIVVVGTPVPPEEA